MWSRNVTLAVVLSVLLASTLPADAAVVVENVNGDGKADIVVENDYVRVVLSPTRGATVADIRCRKALVLPFIADKGAGVAATGALFADIAAMASTNLTRATGAEAGRKILSMADTPFRQEPVKETPEQTTITFSASVPGIGPKVTLKRAYTFRPGDSGFVLTRSLSNGGDAPITLQFGSRSRQQPETWRINLRLWMGNGRTARWIFGPYNQGRPQNWAWGGNAVQWQMASQYGVGLLARTAGVKGKTEYQVHYPKTEGVPFTAQWLAAPVTLKPGETLTLETAVLAGEGIPQIGQMGDSRVAAACRMQSCADPGDTFPAFATVASATGRKVQVDLEKYYHIDRRKPQIEKIETREVTLEPGSAVQLRFTVAAPKKGLLYVTCKVRDGETVLASGSTRAWIDDGPGGKKNEFESARLRYLKKMPELHYQGTWVEIGRQLAKEKKIRPGKAGAKAGAVLALYRKHFPCYADILKGAAEELNVPVEKMAAAETPEGRLFCAAFDSAPRTACMAFYINGPDGPICAYSKERGGTSTRGQGYMKMLPTNGYKFHMYTLGGWSFGYGINEKGLCTGGATINCDVATDKAGKALTSKWLAEGKIAAPLGVLMMLTSCATVDEAVRFIDNPAGPFSFTGNMLIVDRNGDAAVLQSVGIKHSIRRYRGPKDRLVVGAPVFAATNYAHPNEAGEFKPGPRWHWYANALLREWRVGRFIEELNGQVALSDCFWLMRTPNQPGGVAQSRFDNVGKLNTTCSFIAHPRTADLYLTNGHPLRTHYQHYRLLEPATEKK